MNSSLSISTFEAFTQTLSDQAARLGSHQMVLMDPKSASVALRFQPLSFSALYALDASEMIHTARHVISLAAERFFNVLRARFFMARSSTAMDSRVEIDGASEFVSSTGQAVSLQEMETLRILSQRVVERLADLHGLHPQEIAQHADSLSVQNLLVFASSLEEEAACVPAFYLGTSELPARYVEVNRRSSAQVAEYGQLLEQISRGAARPYRPLETKELQPDIVEVASMEFLTTELTYRWPRLSDQELLEQRVECFITGYGNVRYRVAQVIDLWEGLIAYKLCPQDDIDVLSLPNILTIRGTQRQIDLPGFMGSMISIWHPNGPGGNVAKSARVFELEEIIISSGKPWIFTGHSMGAKIAVALASRDKIQPLVRDVHSFGSPGRDKDHLSPEVPATPRSRMSHMGSFHDPIFQLGDAREGATSVILTAKEPGRALSTFEMIHRAADSLLNHHSCAQLLRTDSWIMVRPSKGTRVARYSPVWGFTHRFVSHHLYGPLKMVALVLRAVWPIFLRLKQWVLQKADRLRSLAAGSGGVRVLGPRNQGTTSAMTGAGLLTSAAASGL